MEIITNLIPLFKEQAMQYGLWETTAAYLVLGVCFIIAWRLPNIINSIKNKGEK
ncbi:hypothetical protein [Rodentibacter pneumotropicus]|uniref:hypothetical protein n=1 Tax=Rodentibacter pneumotropicus TaxID=758 RepID=UPI001863BE6F|nr:hypothetical protein [Rodentibacter pneumotropicus]